jgi:hypothetical protein
VDLAPFLTFGGAVLTAIITVIGTIYVARSRTKFELGASITTGFKELTDQLQEERDLLSEIISKQRIELAELEKTLHAMEKSSRLLKRHCVLLEGLLEKHGVAAPEHDLY